MLDTELWMIFAMVLYFAVIVGVGIFFTRRSNKSSEEYFIGGRGLGPWLTALSAEASDMSGWLLMGLPGLAYFYGCSSALWVAVGLITGTYLNWKLVARRLRRYSEIANNSITLPDYFSNRFHDTKKILMTISAIVIFVFFCVYVGSCFVTCGKLFNTLFGVDYLSMMIFAAVVVFVYTFMGGYLSVCTTDLIQSILMCCALVLIFFGSIISIGGVDNVANALSDIPGFLSAVSNANPLPDGSFGIPESIGIISIVSSVSWGLGYFGIPHILVRFMSIRSESEVKKSRMIAVVWLVISLTCAVCIGLIGRAMMPTEFLTQSAAENIFIVMSKVLLPSFLCGLVATGILAASMSSSSSYLLIAGSTIAKNIFKGLIKKEASDKQIMLVARLTLIVVMIFGIVVALDENSTIFNITAFAWSGFGASFGPLVLFSLYWKRTTLPAAIAGMITGGVTVFMYECFLSPLGGIFEIYSLLPCFVLSCLVILIVSKLTKAPSEKILSEFEEATN